MTPHEFLLVYAYGVYIGAGAVMLLPLIIKKERHK